MTRLLLLLSLSSAFTLPAWNQAQACGGGARRASGHAAAVAWIQSEVRTYFAARRPTDRLVSVVPPANISGMQLQVRATFVREGTQYEQTLDLQRMHGGWVVVRVQDAQPSATQSQPHSGAYPSRSRT